MFYMLRGPYERICKKVWTDTCCGYIFKITRIKIGGGENIVNNHIPSGTSYFSWIFLNSGEENHRVTCWEFGSLNFGVVVDVNSI